MFKWSAFKSVSPRGGAGESRQARGAEAEQRALRHLQAQGMRLLERNYRVAQGPHAPGGEIDLILQDPAGSLVFVEVRARRSAAHGGAAASIGAGKRRRILLAAQHYLLRYRRPPPCRFDVIAIDGRQLLWLQAAFDAG
ncbi:YraN family protein [Mitsuaria sp. WAJ17]|uniref:YraN family protein n=1 Tax=Mitsuaria sp. WAJ17 TaxID=2761452 RepID=UPI0015FEF3F4|nr:YraN family protein [Mitsuaria sp. WAJ17]MBB2484944.1 YraN family protein [Mitsuaria sp. WAJ17]